VASVIAVCQAGERIGGFLSCIQILVNAPSELTTLVHATSNIRAALVELQSRISTSNGLFPRSGCAHLLLRSCLVYVDEIESLVASSLSTRDAPRPGGEESTIKRPKRMVWLRKRKKIARLKQQLEVALSAVQLELLPLNLLVQHRPISHRIRVID
jgi:hypothetical protein